MKILFYSLVVLTFLGCNNNNGTNNSKMHYGAPRAEITSTPTDTAVKGPLG
jgi:uncharacterized lipoprotein NlpE involved in copper resistance